MSFSYCHLTVYTFLKIKDNSINLFLEAAGRIHQLIFMQQTGISAFQVLNIIIVLFLFVSTLCTSQVDQRNTEIVFSIREVEKVTTS